MRILSRPLVLRSSSALPARLASALVAGLLLIGGVNPSSEAAPPEVPFPAAAGVRPGPVQVGPIVSAGGGTALVPNDVIGFDDEYTGAGAGSGGGAIINFSVHSGNTVGTETILASGAVGTGTAYGMSGGHPNYAAVSPGGLVYYFSFRGAYDDLVQLDPATLNRTVVSAGDNLTLGPPASSATACAWDFSSGTVIYFDVGNSNNAGTRGAGFFRTDPVTGKRYAVSLAAGSPGSGVAFIKPQYPVVDTFGNIFYLEQLTDNAVIVNGNPVYHDVVEIPVVPGVYDSNGFHTYGARAIISNNTIGSGTFQYAGGLWVDATQTQTLTNGMPGAESLIVTDEGTSQTNSAIDRVPSNTGAKSVLISYNGTNANTGSAVFDFPLAAVPDTTGRLYYREGHNYEIGGTTTYMAVIPAGTHAATYLTGAENLSIYGISLTPVPPPTPALAVPTVSNALGATAQLNGNVTADGGVANSGVISRGFVYALTSANATPKIGGANVTPVVNFQAATVPVAQNGNLGTFSNGISGLTSGVSYTLSAFAQNVSGYTYTTPVMFVTASAPAISTNTATSITGVSATLGGNVTSDGGATLSSRGFVYSSSNTMPTIGGSGVTNFTDASAATGTFTDGTGNLLANGTTYYFRAYAANAVGTTYGSILTFTTVAAPTANSQSVSVAFNTATPVTLTGGDSNNPPLTLTYAVTAAPTHGALSGTSPNLTYTPTSGYHGGDTFQFTTSNGSVTSAVATVTLTVAAGTPTANNQSVNVPFNTATAITLTATDPDVPALTLTYTVGTSPTHGTLSGTAPNLTYTPTANYQGADGFTFRVSNGTNTSTNATVSITVTAGTPTATAQSVNVNFNLPRTFTLTGTDPDSPALALTYSVATQPANGVLSGTAPSLTYTPNTGYFGGDSFTFTVSNGQKSSAAATVSLTVIGEPTISGFTPASGPVGTMVTITGTNLQNATGLTFFRNVAGTSFTLVSSTQVTAVVPAGAKTGILTVLSGSGSNNSSTKFDVTP